MSRRAWIYRDDLLAGTLEETEDGQCVFTYLPEYLEQSNSLPVSLTLPLSAEPVATRGLHPFFDGLVPEGWLLDLATRNWKIDPRDRMALLLATCSDCIGAVRVLPREEL